MIVDPRLAVLIQRMDVPPHKHDVDKLGNVLWLLTNLRTRNASRPGYKLTIELLLSAATSANALKKSEIRDYQTHIDLIGDLNVVEGIEEPDEFVPAEREGFYEAAQQAETEELSVGEQIARDFAANNAPTVTIRARPVIHLKRA